MTFKPKAGPPLRHIATGSHAMSKRLLILFALLPWRPAHADTPLTLPQAQTACSPSRRICARTDPAAGTTIARNEETHELLWSIPGWHRWVLIADDGKTAVIGYAGRNLVPLDVSLSEPVLEFYSAGKLVHAVTLGELYRRREDMSRGTSRYAWVEGTSHFNSRNQLVIQLPDGRTVSFSPRGRMLHQDPGRR